MLQQLPKRQHNISIIFDLTTKKQWKLMLNRIVFFVIDQSNNLFPNTCFSRLDNRFKISKFVVPGVAVVVG